jgi:hypothetical protein
MTALLLTSLAAPAAKVMLLITHVASAADVGGSGEVRRGEAARKEFGARAVLNRQCRRVLATSQEHKSGPQNESAPISLRSE